MRSNSNATVTGNYNQEQSLYQGKIMVDSHSDLRLNIQIVRVGKKVLIRSYNPRLPRNSDNNTEIELHLKQVTQLLMQCGNDFDILINECLFYKEGRLLLKDLNRKRYSSYQIHNLLDSN